MDKGACTVLFEMLYADFMKYECCFIGFLEILFVLSVINLMMMLVMMMVSQTTCV